MRKKIYKTKSFVSNKVVADYIVKTLKSYGVVIQRYDALTTDSIYLKFDFGVANSMRIGNHRGKPYPYRFMIRTDKKNHQVVQNKKYASYVYSYDKTNTCLRQVLADRQKKIDRYGLKNYTKIMDKNKGKIGQEKGFWSSSKLV